MKNITLLLGAGFSKLADIPSGDKLNKCLKKMTANSENLIVKFIFQKYLEQVASFNYEEFYDFLLKYASVNVNAIPLTAKEKREFDELFSHKATEDYFPNTTDKIKDFENIYINRLFHLLNIDFNKSNMVKYDCFIDFINNYKEEYSINIFSLNHDLLIESLFIQNKIDFSDGFTTEPLKFQHRLNKPGNQVRDFRHFTNTFNSNTNLYKLHGSLDLYYLKERGRNKIEYVKTKEIELPYDVFDSKLIELKSENKYDSHPYPQFLTGKDSKKFYLETPYFKEIFASLKKNIDDTKNLIIIGYSFEDEHINQILKETISKRGYNSGLKIMIVDYQGSEEERKKFTKKIYCKTCIDLIDIQECSQKGLFKTKDYPFYLFDNGVSDFFNFKLYKSES